MKLPLTGGCQCGGVRYEIAAEPLTVLACHCTECQRQSGAAFGLSMIVPTAAVRITKGTPKEWERPGSMTHSGLPTACLFCDTCGARLYNIPARAPQNTVLKPGTLDDKTWFEPVGHIWTRSAQSWVDIPAGMLRYDGPPPDFAALQAAWAARGKS